MYENVVYAIIAIGFLIMRPQPKKRMIPLRNILENAGFVIFMLLAVTQSFAYTASSTSFAYTGNSIQFANTTYTQANTFNGSNTYTTVPVFIGILLLVVDTAVQIIEDFYNNTANTVKKIGNTKL